MPRDTDDIDVAAFDPTDQPDADDLQALVNQLDAESPLLASVLDTLVEAVSDLQTRVEQLEDQQEATHDIATTAVGNAARNENELDTVERKARKNRQIAKTAVGKAEQAIANPDHQEDAQRLPADVEPSSSPLDFFANCEAETIREVFVEQSNRTNTYRAVAAAKRWPEFGTVGNTTGAVAFERDDLQHALTAELGEKPHRQTVSRVWDKMLDLGGTDLELRDRQISNQQEPRELLVMERDTAEGLLEERYAGLDLLDGADEKTVAGGVTPVVTESEE